MKINEDKIIDAVCKAAFPFLCVVMFPYCLIGAWGRIASDVSTIHKMADRGN
jgi:hypothetical protein